MSILRGKTLNSKLLAGDWSNTGTDPIVWSKTYWNIKYSQKQMWKRPLPSFSTAATLILSWFIEANKIKIKCCRNLEYKTALAGARPPYSRVTKFHDRKVKSYELDLACCKLDLQTFELQTNKVTWSKSGVLWTPNSARLQKRQSQ